MSCNRKLLGKYLERIFAQTHDGAVDRESVRALFVICGDGTAISIQGTAGRIEGVVPSGAEPTLSIVDDGYDALMEFVDEALKDDELRELVGRESVRKQVTDFVQSSGGTMPEGDAADLVRYEIAKPLRAAIRSWVCVVPVVNLQVKASLEIGSTKFVPRPSGALEAIRFVIEHRYAGNTDKQEAQCYMCLELVNDMTNSATAFARVTFRAHPKHANAVAVAHAENAINLLRAFTHAFYRHDLRARFGLPTEIQPGLWWSMAMGQDDHHTIHSSSHKRGSLAPFELDDTKISYLTEHCQFETLRSIAARAIGERNTLERAILQSVQSIGRSVVAPSVDRAFLGCAIALERLLIVDKEEATTERFADRLALLIGAGGEQRAHIAKTAKRLYKIRSQIVHAGLRDVVDDDWKMIEELAVSAVVTALGHCHKLASHVELRDHLNSLKYESAKAE